MKAIFTLATPRPGEVVSGVEIEVDGLLQLDAKNGESFIGHFFGKAIRVKETPEEVRQIIEATKVKAGQPQRSTDDTPNTNPNG